MVFSSIIFLFMFLPLVLLIYFVSPRKLKNLVILVASLFFYAWGEPVYVVLMLISSIADYGFGMMAYKNKQKGNVKLAKLAVVLSCVVNLGLLGFFKYADFLILNINSIFNINLELLNLPLPIGISFYSFQTMSYTIDVYRGDAPPQKNPIALAAYVTLFPQLIAGPIVRYQTVADQLNNRTVKLDQIATGIRRFIIGLGKKVIFANNIGALYDTMLKLPESEITVLSAWLTVLAFGLQIYFDFSGYSDMAIGLGKIFGFDFLENFNYPYISKSITEFWRRWHMSLGQWFRDYVYIPLGGNRCSFKRNMLNIGIVWFLTGLWHGASWNYILWGVYFGLILILEKNLFLKFLKKMPNFLQHIYALFFIIIGWAIFAFEDMGKLGKTIAAMFGVGVNGFSNQTSTFYLFSYALTFVILIIAATPLFRNIACYLNDKLSGKKLEVYQSIVQPCVSLLILTLSVAYLVSSSFNPFLYFRF